ncbi:uncharacterized protein LOC122651138 [Telopea speciosissima]|uniref:uncharacterized protein LOC122651138 n=1 Tax=Telopea speciosissima TaxID=54955 RepID=UPI001CC79D30|nr:uncharacterized protein LOC122651138 [Telopea speciosissima]
MDENKGLFPIAYVVVEVECKESWLFFLNLLHDIIDPDDANRMLTFMSDKQKGLADAIASVFPNAYIRCCSSHLYQNFKKKYPGDAFRKHFWTASSVCTVNQFESAMSDIRTMDNTAYEWLMKDPESMWARHAFDTGAKSDHITNNMLESFNQWVSTIRTKPILTLIDTLRLKIMDRMYHKFQKGQSFQGTLTPMVRKKKIKIQEASKDCISHGGADDEFEVIELTGRRCVVKLRQWSCTCKVWDVTGLPCKHAASAIAMTRY